MLADLCFCAQLLPLCFSLTCACCLFWLLVCVQQQPPMATPAQQQVQQQQPAAVAAVSPAALSPGLAALASAAATAATANAQGVAPDVLSLLAQLDQTTKKVRLSCVCLLLMRATRPPTC